MTDTKTFAGLPVQGHGGYGRDQKPQRSREELEALFTAALAVEGLEAIRWKQYTPYFNDGDTCYFSVHDVYFRTEGASEDGGEYDDGFFYASDPEISGGPETKYQTVPNPNYDPTRGSTYSNRPEIYQDVPTGRVFPQRAGVEALQALSRAVPGGEFDNVLLELFGDHVEVTVSPTGIAVDEYEHD